MNSIFLLHEVAFLVLFGLTAIRLFFKIGFSASSLLFVGLTCVPVGLSAWCRARPSEYRWRVRLLLYVPIMALTYSALKSAAPLLCLADAGWLQRFDRLLIGQNASLWFQPLTHLLLTDLFGFLYLGFFGYLAWTLWLYGRGDIFTLKKFVMGLFVIYGIGFLGYTFVSAAGPYLDIPNQFTTPLHGGWMTRFYTTTVLWGSNRTDCFPCLHLAVSFFILGFDRWHSRARFRWMIFPCVGIWISTLYLRQHYFTDLVAGGILASFALWSIRPGRILFKNDIDNSDGRKYFFDKQSRIESR